MKKEVRWLIISLCLAVFMLLKFSGFTNVLSGLPLMVYFLYVAFFEPSNADPLLPNFTRRLFIVLTLCILFLLFILDQGAYCRSVNFTSFNCSFASLAI